MTTLYDAHRQWAVRPPDERFESLESLHQAVESRRLASHEQTRRLGTLSLTAYGQGALAINGDSPPAALTNWSFGQLCSLVGAPARYLRTLPPELVTMCVRHSLTNIDTECRLLLRHSENGNGSDHQICAAFTGSGYGRIWDASVIECLMEAVRGTPWHVPPANTAGGSKNAGLYASDRDMFVFMVNSQDTVEVGNAKLGRGFFLWNSEAGAATFGITTFLYNYVCGNHLVYGAEDISELRIIHRNHAPERLFREAIPVLNRFVDSSLARDRIQTIVSRSMETPVGTTLEEVMTHFQGTPFTKKEITSGWEMGIAEQEDVTTLWGMVQGLTAFARDERFADRRVDLERRTGLLLTQGHDG